MKKYPFKLEDLSYDYQALMPHMSEETLKFHHGKHLLAYINNLNTYLESNKELQDKTIIELLSNKEIVSTIPTIRNNGGGYLNHLIFFNYLTSPEKSKITTKFKEIIESNFGSIEKFKEEFKNAGMTQFGSGWAWLVKDGNNYRIVKSTNQDNPITDGLHPVFGIDVWEHAYYIDYRNLRADYIDNIFNIINWEKLEERL